MNNNPAPSDADKEQYYEIAQLGGRARARRSRCTGGPMPRSIICSTIFERVNREVPIAPLRWSIAHLNDASDEDARADARARRRLDGAGRDVLRRRRARAAGGAGRGRRMPPVVTGTRLGVAIGAGTDAHRVASYNPFTALQWFARRQDRGRRCDARPGGDAEPRGRAALLHARAARGSRTTRTSAARSRPASSPTSPCSRRTTSPCRRTRSAASSRCSRWSAARSSTPPRLSPASSSASVGRCRRRA